MCLAAKVCFLYDQSSDTNNPLLLGGGGEAQHVRQIKSAREHAWTRCNQLMLPSERCSSGLFLAHPCASHLNLNFAIRGEFVWATPPVIPADTSPRLCLPLRTTPLRWLCQEKGSVCNVSFALGCACLNAPDGGGGQKFSMWERYESSIPMNNRNSCPASGHWSSKREWPRGPQKPK